MHAIISGVNSNSQIFYSSYINTYIERDVRGLSNAIDSLKFHRFVVAVAARCGHQSNADKGVAWHIGNAGNYFLSAPLYRQSA